MTESFKGLAAFLALSAILLALGIAAYLNSGHMGIEERFNEAVGSSSPTDELSDGGGFLGFKVEGDLLSYLLVLSALFAACVLLYCKFRL